jgi:hypothetical protein
MRKVFTAVAVCALAASLGLVSALSAAPGNKYASFERPAADGCQGGDDTGNGSLDVSITSPETLWPPNHKGVPASIRAIDSDNDEVTLTTGGTHNQIANGEEYNGSGNTDPATDVNPPAASDTGQTGNTATNQHQVRAERAGTDKAGRTYTLTYTATGNGAGGNDSCTGTFTIFVPHDQRGGAGWKA